MRIFLIMTFLLTGIMPLVSQTTEDTSISCSDGIDNDGDGLIDCEDPDCDISENNGCDVCFSDGLSFADEVIDYSPECLEFLDSDLINPLDAIGMTDFDSSQNPPFGSGRVTLGEGGSITLGFTNNLVTNSGDSDPDVWVFEVGIDVEGTFLSFRPYDAITTMILETMGIPDVDADGFFEFGAIGGSTASLDLDAVITGLNFGEIKFDAIKLTDDADFPCGASSGGADIDAVCALSSIPQEICDNDIDDDNDGFVDCEDPDLQSDCCCIDPKPLDLGEDTSICQGEFLLLDAGEGFISYEWQDGSTSQTIVANQEQYYSVIAVDSCENIITDSIFIDILQLDTFYNSFTICEGDSILFNNTYYYEEGMYTVFEENDPCINVFIIDIGVNDITTDTLEVNLCQGSTIAIHNEIYSEAGTYQQILQNSNLCDSILVIEIEELSKSESFLHHTLCNDENININQETYSTSGEYIQVLENTKGCDSTIYITIEQSSELLLVDFNDCNALIKELENASYEEFVHSSSGELSCGSYSISNVYRLEPMVNKHSCTPGVEGSIAMCVSSLDSCDYDGGNNKSVRLEFTIFPDQNESISFNCLQFFEKAPENFDWIDGDSGLNNYPQYYGLRVLKDQNVIFEQIDIPTKNDWSLQKFNFSSNAEFTVTEEAKFEIEILPYCLIGNESEVAAWDIDELSISAQCSEGMFRIISGTTTTSLGEEIENALITNKGQSPENVHITYSTNEGGYAFENNLINEKYTLTAYKNDDLRNGVTTLDLMLIQRHILGLDTFTSPYQLVAADINNDNKLSVSDLLQLRKLILGFYAELPNNTSWRFIDKKADASMDNIWNINEVLIINNLNKNYSDLDFLGIKVGDVNGLLSLQKQNSEERNKDYIGFEIFRKGNTYSVRALQAISFGGIQLGINIGNNSLVNISSDLMSLNDQNYRVKDGILYLSYNETELLNIGKNEELFNIELIYEKNNSSKLNLSLVKVDDFNSEIYVGEKLLVKSVLVRSSIENTQNQLIAYPNFPNPFSDYTHINYEAKVGKEVHLLIYDLNGKILLEKNTMAKKGIGSFRIIKSDLGISKGIGIYKLTDGVNSVIGKMTII